MTFDRKILAKHFAGDERMIRSMEKIQEDVGLAVDGLQTTAETTNNLEAATVLVLSSNQAFTNERVLKLGKGLSGVDQNGELVLQTSDIVPTVNGGFRVVLVVAGDSQVRLPLSGTLATVANPETLERKTLKAPKVSDLGNFADDAAAAVGLVPVGGVYRNGSALMVRVA